MHSFFDPHSPQGRIVAGLWWAMLATGTTVWVVVVVAMFVALGRHRAESPELAGSRRAHRVFAVAAAIATAILVAFLAYDFGVDRALGVQDTPDLTIDVTGHQWWWQVDYEDSVPTQRLVTANEIHVPAGRLVAIRLHAADVIHSFWAPNLSGKHDLIPGYESSLRFRADTPGVYRGQCAEFCGLQHAKMAFFVVAQSPNDFAKWRAASLSPDPPPVDSEARAGQRVFSSGGCPVCHAIAGTDARGQVGPSLSHLASRLTLASGTLANNRANLMGWITNPGAIKPGTLMPRSQLTAPELQALVAYLETLQ